MVLVILTVQTISSFDRDEDLVEMPFITGFGAALAQCIRVGLSELQAPLAYCLVGHRDTAFCQQFFDITAAEGEPKIEPDGVTNNRGRETIAAV